MADSRYPFEGGQLPSRLTIAGSSNWGATAGFAAGMARSHSNNYLQGTPSRIRATNMSGRGRELDT